MNNRPHLLFVTALLLITATACGEDPSPETATLPDTATVDTAATTTNPANAAASIVTAAPATTRAPETTTTDASQATTASETTTTSAPVEFEPTVLSYNYPASGDLRYSIAIEQQASVELDTGIAEELPPSPIEVDSILAGTIGYKTSTGPQENTTRIRILSDLSLVENRVSMGGVAMPASEIESAPGFEERIDITVVVDQQGNVLEFSSDALENLLGGENFLPNNSLGVQQLNRPFGPVFPDRPVAVGDAWTERVEQAGPGSLIITNAQHRLVAVGGTEKRPILVIESTYQTEAFEWDMTEMVYGMFGALAEEVTEGEAQAGQETLPEFQLLITVTPGAVQVVARFDPQVGLVIQGDYQTRGRVTTDMTIPGEGGQPFTIITATEYDQGAFYELIEDAS